jgi:hypothetical protein
MIGLRQCRFVSDTRVLLVVVVSVTAAVALVASLIPCPETLEAMDPDCSAHLCFRYCYCHCSPKTSPFCRDCMNYVERCDGDVFAANRGGSRLQPHLSLRRPPSSEHDYNSAPSSGSTISLFKRSSCLLLSLQDIDIISDHSTRENTDTGNIPWLRQQSGHNNRILTTC